MIGRRAMMAGTLAGVAMAAARGSADGAETMTDRPRLVMWGAALMAHPLAERLEAVAESGFTHTTVFPADMKAWRREGLSDGEITRMIRASGVGIATIDPYTGWVPGWSVAGLDDFTREFIEVSQDDVLRMAEVLETGQINLVESAGSPYEEGPYAEAMAAFAERARAHGLQPTFEFMPTSKIADLRTGWKLIEASGAEVGLTFDTWHFWRSDPDHDFLATLPMERLLEVQIADGGAEVVEDLQTDLLYHRRVPGEGDFDLARTVSVLRGMGPLRSIGPETFSQEMNETAADVAVRRNGQGLAALMPGQTGLAG